MRRLRCRCNCGSDTDEWLGVLLLCRGVAPKRCDRYVVRQVAIEASDFVSGLVAGHSVLRAGVV